MKSYYVYLMTNRSKTLGVMQRFFTSLRMTTW